MSTEHTHETEKKVGGKRVRAVDLLSPESRTEFAAQQERILGEMKKLSNPYGAGLTVEMFLVIIAEAVQMQFLTREETPNFLGLLKDSWEIALKFHPEVMENRAVQEAINAGQVTEA